MSPCLHYDCSNRNSFGYCKTTVCINSNYATGLILNTWNKTEPVVYKPQTNADRIRSMTDEELAKQFATQSELDWNSERPLTEKAWLDWLKEEVTDGNV